MDASQLPALLGLLRGQAVNPQSFGVPQTYLPSGFGKQDLSSQLGLQDIGSIPSQTSSPQANSPFMGVPKSYLPSDFGGTSSLLPNASGAPSDFAGAWSVSPTGQWQSLNKVPQGAAIPSSGGGPLPNILGGSGLNF